MWRDALRRLLALVPAFGLVTLALFAFLAAGVPAGPGTPDALFVELSPRTAREHALAALQQAVEGRGEAAAELLALGGAALPHLLPRLESLPPVERDRVVNALRGVASRLDVPGATVASEPEAAIAWARFWREHALDFHPAAVRRAVERVASRPSALRARELRRLDTYALEALVERMRPVEVDSDVARVATLTALSAGALPAGPTVPPGASVEEARAAVSTWERLLRESSGRYTAPTGAARLGAVVRQSRYGRWAESALAELRHGDRARLGALIDRARVTTALLLLGVLLGHPLGFLLGALPAALRWRAGAAALAAGGAAALSLASLALAASLPGRLAALAIVAAGAGSGVLAARAGHAAAACGVAVRTHLAQGAPPLRAALGAARALLAPALARAAADLPGLASLALVVEKLAGLPGLAEPTVRAVHEHDIAWLNALACAGAVAVGLCQVLAELLQGIVDPRLARGPDREAEELA